jgi:hypothetical protein
MVRKKFSARNGATMAAKKKVEKKSATDSLLEGIDELIDSAAETMTVRQFKKAEKDFNAVVDRAVAARSRKRETA